MARARGHDVILNTLFSIQQDTVEFIHEWKCDASVRDRLRLCELFPAAEAGDVAKSVHRTCCGE